MPEFLYRVNDMIPDIFENIIRTYNFKFKRINPLRTILYKEDYAITMSVNMDYVNIDFLKKEGNIVVKYWIQPFLMQNLDDEDRSNCREGDDIITNLINYLLIYEKVLQAKHKNILMGQMDWVEEYKKSSMRSIRELYPKEYDTYKVFLLGEL